MVSRKRARQEMEVEEVPREPSTLERIRNMWEFANIGQYLSIFGKAIKIEENLDVGELETELLGPQHSERLSALGLALLKFVSSHRGLTPDMFDEYTRRQYQVRLPERNPFGEDEIPKKFLEFDVFTKIRVLYQLSQWTMIHSERIREKMDDGIDQTEWRVEPAGWDSKNRTYFVLEDIRVYRRTDPPPPPESVPKPKKNSKKAKAAARASKRRKVSAVESEEADEAGNADADAHDDGLGGAKWECVAATLEQLRDFVESIRQTKHADEKDLYDNLTTNTLPILEKEEEERKKKEAKREKELLALEKLATAKRSSRIAGKIEKQKEEEEAAEAERKRQADLIMAKKEQERLKKLEQERESRIMTREQRLKEREMKRILHEEELANLSEDSKKLENGEARKSERQLKSEIEKHKQALEEFGQEDDWIFDCSVCGVNGENLDDGSHSIACEKCNVWQHSACLGVSQEEAERSDFHFICKTCKRRMEDQIKAANSPKITLKFRLGPSVSPSGRSTAQVNGTSADHKMSGTEDNHDGRTQGTAQVGSSGNGAPVAATIPNGIRQQPQVYNFPTSTSTPSVMNGIAPVASSVNGSVFSSPSGPSLPKDNSRQQQMASLQPYPIPSVPFTAAASHQYPASNSGASFPTKPFPPMSPTPGNKGTPAWHLPPPATPHSASNGTTFPQWTQPYAPRSTSPLHQIQHSPLSNNVSILPHPNLGLSPTKNTPSRPLSSQSMSSTPVLPPVASLSPSPRQQDLPSPSKGMTPEQLRSNGYLVQHH